jgi:serine/threonine protein phosphatase 1
MTPWLQSLLGRNRSAPVRRPRFRLEEPQVVYAIGDIHGCLAQLQELEAQIADDCRGFDSVATILLGDLIDRGPSSAQVIDYLLTTSPPGNHARYCLAGNHEMLMSEFIGRPFAQSSWLDFGGIETLASYGVYPDAIHDRSSKEIRAKLDSYIPSEHLSFLDGLPVAIETDSYIFVHAGMQPHLELAQQADADLMWYRDDFVEDYQDVGKVVVHGHTPLEIPLIGSNRIGIDTGAYLTGRLSAVRLERGTSPRVLVADANPNKPKPSNKELLAEGSASRHRS